MAKRPAIMFYTGDWMKDPHLAMCSPSTRGIWIDMLCLMHENSESGKLSGDLGGVARACRCTPEQMYDALHELHQYSAADVTLLPAVTEDHTPVAVQSRRLVREHNSRKSNADRQKRWRERQGDDDVTPDSQGSAGGLSSSSSSSVSYSNKKRSLIAIYDDPAFQEFWKCAYRKTSKGSSAKAFDRACRRADPQVILAAWKKQNEQWRKDGADKRYVPHPATWLNGDRWEDEMISMGDNGKADPPDDLVHRKVEMIGGPAAGATGRVVWHEGDQIKFYDGTFRHDCHVDEVKVVD